MIEGYSSNSPSLSEAREVAHHFIFLKKDSLNSEPMKSKIQTSEVRTKTEEAMIHKMNNARQ